jgi:phosphoribosylformimino-5-aminoimidazole carboxamide ribotide isomerase
MELYPAIDIRGGKCVRLRQGDYADETIYGDDPVVVALSFAEAGARWIHIVDLDAARTGNPVNRPVIRTLTEAVRVLGVSVETGGGVRSLEDVRDLAKAGVARVIIGTAAVESPSLVAEAAAAFPNGVAVGLDARLLDSGRYEVAVRGWVAGSGHDLFELVDRFDASGASAFIVTEIGRDGMLTGPDTDGLARVLERTNVGVIASGGVSSIEDLQALRELRGGGRALIGAIAGKAIYEKRFTVAEGVQACRATK